MHELSVALEVCRMAQEKLGPEEVGAVRAIGLEVGDDAGLEVENLLFCLETLLAEPPFTGAKPIIMRQRGDTLRMAYLEVDDGRPDH
jgi:Zn finger protein HypA/HybF involved in hydrogenase expression